MAPFWTGLDLTYHLDLSMLNVTKISLHYIPAYLVFIHLLVHHFHYQHSHHLSLLHSFTQGLKHVFSRNTSPHRLLVLSRLPSWITRIFRGFFMLIVFYHYFLCLVICDKLSWLHVSFWGHGKYLWSIDWLIDLSVFAYVHSFPPPFLSWSAPTPHAAKQFPLKMEGSGAIWAPFRV